MLYTFYVHNSYMYFCSFSNSLAARLSAPRTLIEMRSRGAKRSGGRIGGKSCAVGGRKLEKRSGRRCGRNEGLSANPSLVTYASAFFSV